MIQHKHIPSISIMSVNLFDLLKLRLRRRTISNKRNVAIMEDKTVRMNKKTIGIKLNLLTNIKFMSNVMLWIMELSYMAHLKKTGSRILSPVIFCFVMFCLVAAKQCVAVSFQQLPVCITD